MNMFANCKHLAFCEWLRLTPLNRVQKEQNYAERKHIRPIAA